MQKQHIYRKCKKSADSSRISERRSLFLSLILAVLRDLKKKTAESLVSVQGDVYTCKHSEVESLYIAAVSQRTSAVTQLFAFLRL